MSAVMNGRTENVLLCVKCDLRFISGLCLWDMLSFKTHFILLFMTSSPNQKTKLEVVAFAGHENCTANPENIIHETDNL